MKPDEGSGRDSDARECAPFFSHFSHDTIKKKQQESQDESKKKIM